MRTTTAITVGETGYVEHRREKLAALAVVMAVILVVAAGLIGAMLTQDDPQLTPEAEQAQVVLKHYLAETNCPITGPFEVTEQRSIGAHVLTHGQYVWQVWPEDGRVAVQLRPATVGAC